jgi:hypothetical protein
MLKFEMFAPQMFLFWLFSRESWVSFTAAQPGSILTALRFEIAYLLLRKFLQTLQVIKTNLAGTKNSNFSSSKL